MDTLYCLRNVIQQVCHKFHVKPKEPIISPLIVAENRQKKRMKGAKKYISLSGYTLE